VYAELPFTQHAFDMLGLVCAAHAAIAVEQFLAEIYATQHPAVVRQWNASMTWRASVVISSGVDLDRQIVRHWLRQTSAPADAGLVVPRTDPVASLHSFTEGRCGLFRMRPMTATPVPVGKVYSLRDLADAVCRLASLVHHAGMVWVLRQIDPAFREEIMLTVARTNGCRSCNYVHQEWAIRAGVSNEEIAKLEGADPATFDRAKWSALAYARALAEADFGQVPEEISQEVAQYYTRRDRRNIEAVALVMSIANRSANTVDAFGSRLRGVPVSESLPAEIAITLALVAVSPTLIPVLSIVLRKSPQRLLRELHAYSAGVSPSAA